MLRVAVASENNMVCGHFGHCETFEVFDTEGDKILSSKSVANPGHRPGFLPNFLHEMGVNTIISGGMGAVPSISSTSITSRLFWVREETARMR
jgi:predicted Fe-Mo cluster-binding NifX family protein